MKKYAVVLVMTSLALTGCGSKEDAAQMPVPVAKKSAQPADKGAAPAAPIDSASPPPAPGVQPATAPGQPVAAAETASQGSVKLTADDIRNLNYAVDMYKTEFKHYPKSLEDMLGTRHLARVPVAGPGQKLSYDPKTGSVKLEGK